MVEWTIDRAIHAAIASGRVPPSITADYLFQSRDTGAKVALLLVGALTTIIVVLRCISRWTARRLGIDDAFACLSSVSTARNPSLLRGLDIWAMADV
jgi:hypothetical protein